jgi:hypothetical protein
VHARKVLTGTPAQEEEGPWLTGPLLTPSGHVIPLGHANYEPYLYWGDYNGKYNDHWNYSRTPPSFKFVLSQTALQFGILPATEIDILPQILYNYCGGQHMWRIPDQPIAIAFQLLMDKPGTWWPAIKMRLAALIPLGKYDHLDPKKLFTDFGGLGDWAPTIGFVTVKAYNFGNNHYLAWRMNYQFTFTLPVPVHGLSFYGGVPTIDGIKGTRGTVYPGCVFVIQQGLEYSITHNWALALDLQYFHSNRNRFSGHSPKGTKPVLPSAEQFSVAPALEYNFNANIGVIAGPWFTVAGRNDNDTDAFITWVFAINIYR